MPTEPAPPVSAQQAAIAGAIAPFVEFFQSSAWARRRPSAPGCDFVAGNPQELAPTAYVDAILEASHPRDPTWFAYKSSEPAARDAAAASLRERLEVPFESDDVVLTKGASTALALVLRTILSPGDEVIFVSPPWFFYEAMIESAGARPVRVATGPATFDLDTDAIAAAISPRTRAVIVNSPNNPTGTIYPAAALARLAEVLTAASAEHSRTVYLLSDEAYNRILFDGRRFVSPTAHYPDSFLLYSYGKTLLTPGQRLGYVALSPTMADRPAVRAALLVLQLTDYGWPDAVLQHALPRLEPLTIDLAHLQAKRDRMVAALRAQGYELHVPEATFYLLPRCPVPDDQAFTERLSHREVYVLPGHVVEMPGYFRISLTASDEMIDRALPVFAEAIAASGL